MNKQTYIKIRSVLILIIYVINVIPFNIFHTHCNHIVAIEKATHCEKSIHYGEKACEHSNHFSTLNIHKCELCDSQSLELYKLPNEEFSFNTLSFTFSYSINYYQLPKIYKPLCINKGPPLV